MKQQIKIEEIDYNEILKIRQNMMYPDKELDFVKLENDSEGIHVGICENGEPVSVVSIFLEDRNIQFRKLATKNEFQNKGYATALVKWILDYAKEMKFNKVWANSRVEVYPFYEKYNFVKTEKFFQKDGRNFVIIEYKI